MQLVTKKSCPPSASFPQTLKRKSLTRRSVNSGSRSHYGPLSFIFFNHYEIIALQRLVQHFELQISCCCCLLITTKLLQLYCHYSSIHGAASTLQKDFLCNWTHDLHYYEAFDLSSDSQNQIGFARILCCCCCCWFCWCFGFLPASDDALQASPKSFYGLQLPASDDALQAPPPRAFMASFLQVMMLSKKLHPTPQSFCGFLPSKWWCMAFSPKTRPWSKWWSPQQEWAPLQALSPTPTHPLHSTPLHSLGAAFLLPTCVFSASWSEGQRRRGCDREAQTPPWYPHPPTSHWICEHQEFLQSNPAASAPRIPWENKDRQGR